MTITTLLLAVALGQTGETAPFIGEFPVQDHAEAKLGEGSALTLTVKTPAGAVQAPELARRFKLRKTGDALAFDVVGYPRSKDAVTPLHRKPSFVIDYDEKPVQTLREKFIAEKGEKAATIEALTEFVDKAIAKKNLMRGFDYASVVARRGEGDCTEHAVLLAALARSFGFPTRVVLGIAMLETPKGLQAFGHAWVEYADKKLWRPADAAIRGITELQYLPLTVMADETASHMGAVLREGGMFAISEIRVDDTKHAVQGSP